MHLKVLRKTPLCVCYLLFFNMTVDSWGQSQTLPVSEDAWVELGLNANFGDSTDLAICPSAGYQIYLKFDASQVVRPVARATLHMRRFSGSRPEEISAYAIDDDSWQESTVHGNALPSPQAPAPEETLAMGAAGASDDIWSSDALTTFVREQIAGDGVVSLLVREDPSPNFDVRRYFSREGARTEDEVPRLVLELEAEPGSPETIHPGWQATDIGSGIKPSFDFAPDGGIHIMGMTEEQTGVVWHASAPTAEGPWEPQPLATGYFYGPGDLVVDSSGTAHVAWHDHTDEDAKHALIPPNGEPTVSRIVTPDSHDGWDNALALAPDGTLHQSSVNPAGFGASTSLQHSVFDGADWTLEPVPESGPFMYGLNTSIAVDRQGYPRIAFCTATDFRSDGELRYAVKSPEGWSISPPIASGPVVGRFPSLALDHWDRPHIAWLDGDSDDPARGIVRYAVLNNDAWEIEDLDEMKSVELSFSEARKSVSLALDALWQPHVAFGDRSVVKYAKKVFGEWEIETVAEHTEPMYKGLVVLRLSPDEEPGIVFWQRHDELPGLVRLLTPAPAADEVRLPGDCDGDAVLNISDPVCLLERLFFPAGSPLPCDGESTGEGGNKALFDANADDTVDLTDAVSVLGFLFLGGPPHALGTECTQIEGCAESCESSG